MNVLKEIEDRLRHQKNRPPILLIVGSPSLAPNIREIITSLGWEIDLVVDSGSNREEARRLNRQVDYLVRNGVAPVLLVNGL